MQCTIQFENLYGANLLNEKMAAGKAGFAILLNKTQNKIVLISSFTITPTKIVIEYNLLRRVCSAFLQKPLIDGQRLCLRQVFYEHSQWYF